MPIWIVMVRDLSFGRRWPDSFWILETSAIERKAQLEETFTALKAEHAAWVVPAKLEDGTLAPAKGTKGTR